MEEIQQVLDALPDKTYYRIGEVARITGVKAYVLRFWETEFKSMAPPKSRSNQRMYRRKDIETILLIKKLLYEERYTIAGARQRLRELGAGRGASAAKPKAETEAVPSAAAEGAAWVAAQADIRRRCQQIRRELVSIRASL